MGNLCSIFACSTESVSLTTPFGSCACGKSICGCFGKNERQTSDQQRQQQVQEQIHAIVTQQLANVEQLMKTAITNNLDKFGMMPVIHVLESDAASPPQTLRALTVRVSSPVHNIIESVLDSDEVKEVIPIIKEAIPVVLELLEMI